VGYCIAWGNHGSAGVRNTPRNRAMRCRLLKKLRATLHSLTAAHPDKTIELWCQDETRVGQKGRRPHGWAPKGTRPPVPIDTRYDNAYVFGVFCPQRDCAVGLILPRTDTAYDAIAPRAHQCATPCPGPCRNYHRRHQLVSFP
jgi:hypothetical protein